MVVNEDLLRTKEILESDEVQDIVIHYKTKDEILLQIHICVAFEQESIAKDGAYLKELFWDAEVVDPELDVHDSDRLNNINNYSLGSSSKHFKSFNEAFFAAQSYINTLNV